jgi:hypothetical protein
LLFSTILAQCPLGHILKHDRSYSAFKDGLHRTLTLLIRLRQIPATPQGILGCVLPGLKLFNNPLVSIATNSLKYRAAEMFRIFRAVAAVILKKSLMLTVRAQAYYPTRKRFVSSPTT